MPLFEMDSVSKVFKKEFTKKEVHALRALSLVIQEGEVFGFLGPNGAGKSTAIKLLLNLIRPSSGSLSIDGRSVSDKSVRRFIGYLPENPYFYDYLNPLELLEFAGKTSGMDSSRIRQKTEELLKTVGLYTERKRAIRSYSASGPVPRCRGMVARWHDHLHDLASASRA